MPRIAFSRLWALLALPAAAWLVLAHDAPPGTDLADAPAAAWLRVVILAVPLALLAAPAAVRVAARLRAGRGAAAAFVGVAVALATAVAASAVGLDPSDRGVLAAFGRDALLALAATLPPATVAMRFAPSPRVQLDTRRLAAPPRRAAKTVVAAQPASPPDLSARELTLEDLQAPPPRKDPGRTTRRRFLQSGGATVGGVAVAGALGRTAIAAPAADHAYALTITEGWRYMVDGTPVWLRGFTTTRPNAGVPDLPGPFLGNPGPAPGRDIREGDTVTVTLTNETPREHTFLIEGTASEAPTSRAVVGPVRIDSGQTVSIRFTAPQAGTYVYRDADVFNRLLGMHGVLVVLPRDADNRLLPYAPAADRLPIPAEVSLQYTWVLGCLDPMLGEYAYQRPTVSQLPYELADLLPRYFLVNGRTGEEATEDNGTVPVVRLQDEKRGVIGVLIRVVNAGVATHSPHWHGNHVFVVQRNGVPERAGFVAEKDVVRMPPLATTDVILPAHTGFDAFPPLELRADERASLQKFPMHCHAEMSQSAGGGMYPAGMLTDWRLVKSTAQVQEQIQANNEARQDRRRLGVEPTGPPAGASPTPARKRRVKRKKTVKKKRRSRRRRPKARGSAPGKPKKTRKRS